MAISRAYQFLAALSQPTTRKDIYLPDGTRLDPVGQYTGHRHDAGHQGATPLNPSPEASTVEGMLQENTRA